MLQIEDLFGELTRRRDLLDQAIAALQRAAACGCFAQPLNAATAAATPARSGTTPNAQPKTAKSKRAVPPPKGKTSSGSTGRSRLQLLGAEHEAHVIAALIRAPVPLRLHAVAEAAKVPKGSITAVVERLIRAGRVTREGMTYSLRKTDPKKAKGPEFETVWNGKKDDPLLGELRQKAG